MLDAKRVTAHRDRFSRQRREQHMPKYQAPGFFTRAFMNPLIMLVGKTTGWTMKNTQTLTVRGRSSGKKQSVPVSPIEVDGTRYLVAPRGTTQWVRNIRASGEAELQLGRKRERITVQEIDDEAKPPVLRPYLKVWAMDMKEFFNGVGPDSSEEDIRREAVEHPVFRITSAERI
jgi:deazaflavin-dependent oxidoreductase (nitroreductase family)